MARIQEQTFEIGDAVGFYDWPVAGDLYRVTEIIGKWRSGSNAFYVTLEQVGTGHICHTWQTALVKK